MARSNTRSNTTGALKFAGAAAVAIIGGAAIGLLITRPSSPRADEPVATQATPAVSTQAPATALPIMHPRPTNGNYTAPGAPRIVIREESAPTLRRVDRTVPVAPADTEASQEAVPVVKTVPSRATSDARTPDDTGEKSTPASNDLPPSSHAVGGADTPPTPPAAPTDPDFERVVKPGDAEAGQEGGGKAQFRVQTGTYTDESNARSVADQLRGQGFSASTRSEREGDHLIYKVQAGAYRSKNGAAKAADDLQKKGFPAYVSPIAP